MITMSKNVSNQLPRKQNLTSVINLLNNQLDKDKAMMNHS
jgi:hypothetical protein